MGHLDLDDYMKQVTLPITKRMKRGRYTTEIHGNCDSCSIFMTKQNKRFGNLLFNRAGVQTKSGVLSLGNKSDTIVIGDIWISKDKRTRGFGTLLYAELCTYIKNTCPDVKTIYGVMHDEYALRARRSVFGEPIGTSFENHMTELRHRGETYVESSVSKCKLIE